jgi:hypothetical protein
LLHFSALLFLAKTQFIYKVTTTQTIIESVCLMCMAWMENINSEFCKVFSITEWRLCEFLELASFTFTFNECSHKEFKDALFNLWDTTFALRFNKYGSANSYISVGQNKNSAKRKRGEGHSVDIVYFSNTGPRTIYTVTREEFNRSIIGVFTHTPWCSTVRSMEQIPPTIHRSLATCRFQLTTFFPSCSQNSTSSSLPYYVEKVICSMRVSNTTSLDQEEQEQEHDSDQPNVLDSSDGTQSTCSMNAHLNGVKSLLMKNNSEQSVSMQYVDEVTGCELFESRMTTVNCYTLSAVVYCLAERGSEDRPRSTEEFYHQICDRLEQPETETTTRSDVNEIARHIEHEVKKRRRFANANEAVRAFHSRKQQNNNNNTSLNEGLLQDIDKMLDFLSDMANLMNLQRCRSPVVTSVLGNMKHVYEHSCSKQPERGSSDQRSEQHWINLAFTDPSVSALDIATTINLLKIRFPESPLQMKLVRIKEQQSEQGSATINMLSVESNTLEFIRHAIIPYYCANHRCVSRTVLPCPIYPLHLRNLLVKPTTTTDAALHNMRLIIGMMSLMKFTERHFRHLSKYYPKADDPVLHCYTLLPSIIDRFKDTDTIWKLLTEPFTDHETVWTQDKQSGATAVKGFRSETFTIYGALRSFAYINARHVIRTQCVYELLNYFIVTDVQMQLHYPLAFKLLIYLRHLSESYKKGMTGSSMAGSYGSTVPDAIIRIPRIGEFFTTDEFPFATHLVLYYLCASKRLPDDLAVNLFMSINVQKDVDVPHRMSTEAHPNLKRVFNDVRLKLMNLFPEWLGSEQQQQQQQPSIPHYGLMFLVEALEQLTYYPINRKESRSSSSTERGSVEPSRSVESNLSVTRQTLSGMNEWLFPNSEAHYKSQCNNNNNPVHIPIQFTEADDTPQYVEDVFPVWPHEFYDTEFTYYNGRFFESLIKRGHIPRDFLPLTGAKREFVETILLRPCTTVKLHLQT